MKKIVFANSKGGVGKTTLTVGVTRVLARLGKKVLILDIDPQGNLTQTFQSKNTSFEKNVSNWYKENASEKELLSTISKSNFENIDIVPNYPKLVTETLNSLTNSTASDFVLKNNLEKIEKQLKLNYDYIFFDINPTTSLVTLNVFLSVNNIIVTVVPHKYSFNGIARFFEDYEEYISKWKKVGIPLNNNMRTIVLNNVRKNKHHLSAVEQLQASEFKTLLLDTIINGNLTLEKHTMLNNPTLTEKSPFFLLTKELVSRGVL